MQDAAINLNQLKPLSYRINADDQISLGGISVSDLVKRYGTPLYVLCEDTLRSRARAYKQSLDKSYSNNLVLYASKALNCKAVCEIIEQEGLGLDVVSAGELSTALSVKFPAQKIFFHGNNKSQEELELAINSGIGSIVLDNRHELNLIKSILQTKTNPELRLMIRITPGIECHTHEYIKTGHIDSKFGFNLSELDALIVDLLTLQKEFPGLKILGLHSHIGSQIFETLPHRDSVKLMVGLYKQIKDKFSLEFTDLNVGGGLGLKYQESDDPPEIKDWIEVISSAVKEACLSQKIKEPRVLVEPGRSIVGSAGATLYTVGNIKNIEGIRKYVAVDGGMADNVRPIMYGAKYLAELNGKVRTRPLETVTIAGKYCESGDILIKDIELAQARSGDILVVYATGAYNYSMASNYNRAAKPAMILVKNGKSQIIIERESLEDLLRLDKGLEE
jgi:diaminopimelate decarboxylase